MHEAERNGAEIGTTRHGGAEDGRQEGAASGRVVPIKFRSPKRTTNWIDQEFGRKIRSFQSAVDLQRLFFQ
jgi:hypothetical protein